MSSEWRETTVETLIAEGVLAPPLDGNHGEIHPKAKDFVDSGIPFIMASDMKDGQVDTTGCAFITHEQASRLRKGFAKTGDVLLSHKATIGRTAVVGPLKDDFVVLTPQVTYYRTLDPQKLNHRYLKYYFDSRSFQETLAAWSGSGSTRAYLGITAQRKLPIVLPPILLQSEIAVVMGSLDDSITLLHETNATLEAIAQALFKSWFIDFDPVRAKAEGLEPEGLDAATAALFPNSFEESELGLVPRGWKAGCVADIAVQKKGSVNPLASPNEWFEHYSLPAFDSGQSPVLEHGESIKSNKTPLPEEAVLLSKLNPHIPRVWLPVKHGGNAVCSTEFLAYSPKAGGTKELIYCLFSSAEFQQQLCQLVTGTSNSHQRVKPDQVLKLRLAIADDSLFIAFADIASPIFERVYANRLKAQTLTQLRETLLPRLISGQLRLPEAEVMIEEVCA